MIKYVTNHLSAWTLMLTSLTGLAQGNENNPMEKLDFLVSEWVVTVVADVQASDPEETRSVIKWAHDGRFVEERVKHLTANGEINMITFIGYDARIKSYKLTAMDKEYGLMDVYTGDWNGDQLTFTNISSDTPILMEDGRKLNFRLTYSQITETSFQHTVEGTYDQGDTWFTFSVNNYQRVK
jgi:hypothetical protein